MITPFPPSVLRSWALLSIVAALLFTPHAALGQSLQPRVIQLDADHAAGFAGRDWSPVNFGPLRHRAYAIQWFALALTVFIVGIIINLRRVA